LGALIFKKTFALKKKPKEHSSKEYLDLLRLQLDIHDQYIEELPRSVTGLHRFFKIYVKGFRGASELRNQLMKSVHCSITLKQIMLIDDGRYNDITVKKLEFIML
jgi:tRNA-dihydrouridine synthase